MSDFSYISNSDPKYIEQMYQKYKSHPEDVDFSWQKFFEGFDFSSQSSIGNNLSNDETNVNNLINAYRIFGHLNSNTNPVRVRRDHNVKFDLEFFNLNKSHLEKEFNISSEIGLDNAKLKDIISKLDRIYLGTIGFEYMHIRDSDEVNWLKNWIESKWHDIKHSKDDKLRILSKLNEALVFENFLHTKYIGQKRFSLEGGENTITFLSEFIGSAAKENVEEVVIGMAHRGRLNVLTSILGKTYNEMFNEFEGNMDPDLTMGDGDVKYHLGYSSLRKYSNNKKIYVKLVPNPSHLESVNPVVQGYVRAQIDDEYQKDFNKAIPILIHGDAAIAGQGLVYEIVQMSKLKGYRCGGTIHFVINNQIGFTTDYDDARSSIYCTDLAKIIDSPVLHINGDDAEAVSFASSLALAYRQKFKKDIFIDLLCYRRHGHNESDEPKFTQPSLYNLIAKHPNPRDVYFNKLKEEKDIDANYSEKLQKDFKQMLQERLDEVRQKPLPYIPQKHDEEWDHLKKSESEQFYESPDTSLELKKINKIAKSLTSLPSGFKPLKQIAKLINDRKENFFNKKMLNWSDAELLAYGSLLIDKKIIRISGQDVIRGTFSHRHAYFFDSDTNKPYCPLNNISKNQNELFIYNSLLSEFAVLGFEYGYAMATPNALVIWEAQFGDFVNGAQVIIDQYISSAETKWDKMNGLVVLLPHGYEGQGPEHSSARPERILSLCSDDNIIVSNLTTPANFFHLLRRQLSWNFRKPCFVLSPKSLLRHPDLHSPISDFTKSKFQEVIDDELIKKTKVKKLILCTGKVYYDLKQYRIQKNIVNIAIVRIEQIYPFPINQITKIIKKYKCDKICWVQEEPKNMGYWKFISNELEKYELKLLSRKRSASPSTGYYKSHSKEQQSLIKKAFE